MRTYYSGPDAVVTDAFLTVKPPKGKSYALSDLDADQLHMSAESDFYSVAGIIVGIFLVSGLVGCMGAIAGIQWNNWWVGLGGVGLAIVIFLATYVPLLLYGDDTVYVLRGVHRGAQVLLYMSSSEAKTFRVWYAVREALEDGPARG